MAAPLSDLGSVVSCGPLTSIASSWSKKKGKLLKGLAHRDPFPSAHFLPRRSHTLVSGLQVWERSLAEQSPPSRNPAQENVHFSMDGYLWFSLLSEMSCSHSGDILYTEDCWHQHDLSDDLGGLPIQADGVHHGVDRDWSSSPCQEVFRAELR